MRERGGFQHRHARLVAAAVATGEDFVLNLQEGDIVEVTSALLGYGAKARVGHCSCTALEEEVCRLYIRARRRLPLAWFGVEAGGHAAEEAGKGSL